MNTKVQWVVGFHAVKAVLKLQPQRAITLFYVANNANSDRISIIETARSLGLSTQPIDKHLLSKKVGTQQHQGIALQARAKEVGNESALIKLVSEIESPLILILDQVQDPHNFGACLRTADAAGVDAVVVAKDNASPITSTVQKVASGAAETINLFVVSNLARSMKQLIELGVWIVGTSDKATATLYDLDIPQSVAIVMGAEGKGMRRLTAQHCDQLVKLPMAGTVVSSLNVSVATGICLFEAVRQRSIE